MGANKNCKDKNIEYIIAKSIMLTKLTIKDNNIKPITANT